jgi:polysaccharide biosynthesis/export protein
MQIKAKGFVKFGLLATVLFAAVPGNAQSGSQKPASVGVVSGAVAQSDTTSSADPHNAMYIIGNDDLLTINVWNEKEISGSVAVRSDGKISLPLVGEVQASGRTPLQLENEITDRLRNYISAPTVVVMVEKINSKKFNILGEVVRPGSYSISMAPTVMDAIALAGGFRDFAKKKDIYILRQQSGGRQLRISFNYKDFVKGKNSSRNIDLEPRDTIIVP